MHIGLWFTTENDDSGRRANIHIQMAVSALGANAIEHGSVLIKDLVQIFLKENTVIDL